MKCLFAAVLSAVSATALACAPEDDMRRAALRILHKDAELVQYVCVDDANCRFDDIAGRLDVSPIALGPAMPAILVEPQSKGSQYFSAIFIQERCKYRMVFAPDTAFSGVQALPARRNGFNVLRTQGAGFGRRVEGLRLRLRSQGRPVQHGDDTLLPDARRPQREREMLRRVLASLALSAVCCHAAAQTVVGMVEQIPVIIDGDHVIARPIYVLTAQKLSAPTVFSGLLPADSTASVACCFEVRNLAPIALPAELAKYAKDRDFVEHMKSIRGYRYVYAAQPTADRQGWTPLMKTLATIASHPQDGSPFSAPVVALRIERPMTPLPLVAGGAKLTLRHREEEKAGRMVYVFTQGGSKVEFSEDWFAD